MERAQRRVLIQYPKRQSARGNIQQERSHLPLKVNTSGVIPPIFASSLLLMPLTVAQFAGQQQSGDSMWSNFLIEVSQLLQHGSPLYMFLYGAGIIFFCFFYTAVVFNPEETAENLKKYGGFIPGIRPGKRTEEYLDYVLTRVTVVGAAYLTVICLVPEFLIARAGIPFYLGGTSLLIVVNVTMDTVTPDPEPPHRPPIWRSDQEGEAEGRPADAITGWRSTSSSSALPAPARAPRRRGWSRKRGWSSFRPATCCAPRSRPGTPVGLQAKAVMEAGELVSDEIVNALIDENLAALSPEQGVIFDGYPRTANQAASLDGLLAGHGRKLDHVIELAVDEDALVDRITGRFTCANCNTPYHDRYNQPKIDGRLRPVRLDRVQAPPRRQ